MSRYKGKVRFLVFREEDEWVLCTNEVPVEVFCDEFIFRMNGEWADADIIEEEIDNYSIDIIMDGVFANCKKDGIEIDIIPYHYYEVFGNFFVNWEDYVISFCEYDEGPDCEYGFETSSIRMLPFKDSKKCGLPYGFPFPLQCA